MAKKSTLYWIALILVIIGGLNWGLVGVGLGDVVVNLGTTIATIVYILIGLAAIYMIFTATKK